MKNNVVVSKLKNKDDLPYIFIFVFLLFFGSLNIFDITKYPLQIMVFLMFILQFIGIVSYFFIFKIPIVKIVEYNGQTFDVTKNINKLLLPSFIMFFIQTCVFVFACYEFIEYDNIQIFYSYSLLYLLTNVYGYMNKCAINKKIRYVANKTN